MNKITHYAPIVLRIGIALVFIWFGTNQFTNTNAWIGYVPASIVSLSPFSVTTLVHLNGAFEVIFGSALLLGFFTRFVACFLALHMFHVMFIVGFNAVGVRDFGLAMATTSIWLFGADRFTLDKFMKKEIE